MAAGRPVLLLLALFAASAAATKVKVTPVEKVIDLLKNLEKKVEEEGKTDAAQYDKYSCFCKEQADEKLYAIEKSEKKIKDLTAKIDALDGEITTLDGEIGDLSTEISGLKTKIDGKVKTREGEHATYVVEAKDLADAIDAVTRAIAALKDSKGNMGGKTDMEIALVQARSVAVLALGKFAGNLNAFSDRQLKVLTKLAQPVSGEAYQYEYHSNDIIATLETLKSKFTSNKEQLDQEEFETNSAFEKAKLGLENEKKFAEKEKAEKQALMEAKTEKKNGFEEDRTQETAEMGFDSDFLHKELTPGCEEKARLFDQRSKTRANELTAISDAMKALEEGVAPNYQANKKLNGLIQTKAVPQAPKGHWVYVEDKPEAVPAKPHSFIQLRGSRASSQKHAEKVQTFLLDAARRIKSPVLSAIALKVTAAEDHFVKVRGLINDLIARLEQEALSEASQKTFCDKAMSDAISSRDKANSDIEDYTAQITGKEADKKKLEEEIADLSAKIAENKKAINEATVLREEQKAENERVIADSEAGKDAVSFALTTLKNFYQNAGSFVQKYKPTNSDRDGNTVADLAPESFDSEYQGAQESSKGIIGMLEVILSDFDRTIEQTTTDEGDQKTDYDTLTGGLESEITQAEGSVKIKKGKVEDIKDDIVGLKDDLTGAESDQKTALGELEVLHSQCVAGEETYAERVAKRNKEIEALKEAHGILENWQS